MLPNAFSLRNSFFFVFYLCSIFTYYMLISLHYLSLTQNSSILHFSIFTTYLCSKFTYDMLASFYYSIFNLNQLFFHFWIYIWIFGPYNHFLVIMLSNGFSLQNSLLTTYLCSIFTYDMLFSFFSSILNLNQQ